MGGGLTFDAFLGFAFGTQMWAQVGGSEHLEGDTAFSTASVCRGRVIGTSSSCRRGKLWLLDETTSVAWGVLSQEHQNITRDVKNLPFCIYSVGQSDRILWRPILMAAKSYGFLTPKSGPWKCVFLWSVLPKMLEVGSLGACNWFGSGNTSVAKGLVTCCRSCKGLKLRVFGMGIKRARQD